MKRGKLTQGEKVVVVAGILLVADLWLLPWHQFSGVLAAAAQTLGRSTSPTAVQQPNAGFGLFATLLALIMVVQILAARFTDAKLPQPQSGWSRIHFYLGWVTAAVVIYKVSASTESLALGAFLAVLFGVALGYGGFLLNRESGGSTGY